MINLLLLCVLFALAIFADSVSQKSERAYLWLGIVGVLLLFGRTMIMRQWLILSLLFLSLLLEALWSRRWFNWASKETLVALSVDACTILLDMPFQALVFGNLMEEFPPGYGRWSVFSTETPLWLQVVALLVLLDFNRYWLHRLDHRSIFFWRFHELHHEISELHFISGKRGHFISYLWYMTNDIGLLYLIGVSQEAFGLIIFSRAIISSLLTHINVDFPHLDNGYPWFAYLIVTPNFHAWHHTVHCRHGANLAEMFPVWDVLFGTFEMPYGSPCEWQFGLEKTEQLPQSVFGKLLSPFSLLVSNVNEVTSNSWLTNKTQDQ